MKILLKNREAELLEEQNKKQEKVSDEISFEKDDMETVEEVIDQVAQESVASRTIVEDSKIRQLEQEIVGLKQSLVTINQEKTEVLSPAMTQVENLLMQINQSLVAQANASVNNTNVLQTLVQQIQEGTVEEKESVWDKILTALLWLILIAVLGISGFAVWYFLYKK